MGTFIGGRRGAYYKAWTPDKLGQSLYLWLDGTDRSTITASSGKITQWNDKSVYRNHVAQSNSSYQPIDQNPGPPAVQNGTGVLTTISSTPTLPVGLQDRVYVIVCSTYSGRAGVTERLFMQGGSNGIGMGQYNSGNGTAGGDSSSQEYQIYSNSTLYGSLATVNTLYNQLIIKTMRISNQQLYLYVNGAQVYTSAMTYNTPVGALNVFNDQGGNTAYQGSLYEMFIAGGGDVLSMQRLVGYVAWKRGLQSILPASHPFKNQPPKILA